MAASKHRCICKMVFCQRIGGEATVRVPLNNREEWLSLIGWGSAPCTAKDPRVSIVHFTADSIVASLEGSGASLVVRPARDAKPTQSNAQMEFAAKNAPARLLRAEAGSKRLFALLMEAKSDRRELDIKLRDLQDRVKLLSGNKRAKTNEDAQSSTRSVLDFHILGRLSDIEARSVCGLNGPAGLEDLFGYINARGVADNLVFYSGAQTRVGGAKPDGTRPKKQKTLLCGLNGLFFTLFLLRTATSLRVTSALFGVSESTGGRAFATWLNFLRGFLRRLARLPTGSEVEQYAPQNFRDGGLSKVAIVLDATETPVDKVWQTDAAWETYSNYKGKATCKVSIGITSGGAICFISNKAFGGRVTDAELVKESGIIDRLVEQGLSDNGMHVMADRGFNTIAPLLMQVKIHYVAPPSKRRGEDQYNREDANFTRDVANLRIHVERAIGAMKEWRILGSKFDSQQFDLIDPCYAVCGALVNLLHAPFATPDREG